MTAKTLPELSPRRNTLFDLPEPRYGLPAASSAILEAVELPTAPDPSGSYWLAFTRDHNEADATAIFRRRYGCWPLYCFDGLGGLLLVGPVPGLEGGV